MTLAGCTISGGGGGSSPCETGSATDSSTVSFANDIQPLLAAKGCLTTGCHGAMLPSSGFVLTTYESMFAPGATARALELCPVVPGDAESSWLIEKVGPDPRSGERMPLLRPPLSEEELELLATWIRDRAPNN